MVSIFTNDGQFSPEYIEELQKRLLKHPINPAYDKKCNEFDNDEPDVADQQISRAAYLILKKLGKLPEGVEWPGAPM